MSTVRFPSWQVWDARILTVVVYPTLFNLRLGWRKQICLEVFELYSVRGLSGKCCASLASQSSEYSSPVSQWFVVPSKHNDAHDAIQQALHHERSSETYTLQIQFATHLSTYRQTRASTTVALGCKSLATRSVAQKLLYSRAVLLSWSCSGHSTLMAAAGLHQCLVYGHAVSEHARGCPHGAGFRMIRWRFDWNIGPG